MDEPDPDEGEDDDAVVGAEEADGVIAVGGNVGLDANVAAVGCACVMTPGPEVSTTVGATVGAAEGDTVSADGADVGSLVGAVGDTVGAQDGVAVGIVGAREGAADGAAVGYAICSAVGDVAGTAVGAAVWVMAGESVCTIAVGAAVGKRVHRKHVAGHVVLTTEQNA